MFVRQVERRGTRRGSARGRGGRRSDDRRPLRTTCIRTVVVPTDTTAHIEGPLVLVANQTPPTASALPAVADLGSRRAQLLVRLVIGVAVAAALLFLGALRMRRGRWRP